MNVLILIQLLLAHILTDFVIQSDKWVEKKKNKGLKSRYFWLHVFLSGMLTYIILMQWADWIVPLFILLTHGLIDYWKIIREKKNDALNQESEDQNEKRTGTIIFLKDQLLHLVAIILAWLYLTNNFNQVMPSIIDFFNDEKSLAILTSFILLVWPAGIIIGKITEPFRKEISTTDSLSKAGKFIGISERILVLS